jgi:hypothetical protein
MPWMGEERLTPASRQEAVRYADRDPDQVVRLVTLGAELASTHDRYRGGQRSGNVPARAESMTA